MRKGLAALLVMCVLAAALVTASHAHLQASRRCEVCATLHGIDRTGPPAAPAPPAACPVGPLTPAGGAPARTTDILSYSPKNSPPLA